MSIVSGAPGVVKILRKSAVVAITGQSVSTLKNRIVAGLWTPGVKLSARSVGWPDHEVQAIVSARIAGKSEDDIKSLVANLLAARKSAS